jgi:tripartite ATP-independent transporter DctM subunit
MTGNEILGLIMLASMMGIIFVGVPISFTLLYIALVFGSIGLGLDPTFNLAYLQIWASMKDDILPAVPLFIFMGFMSEQAGLMNRLFEALRNILAPVRGALYLAVLLTATIFAMATGIIGAAVTVLGIVAGPIMVKSGYDARLSAGAIAAGGSLGILIPPSVMLLVMGPLLGVPVNHLYSAAFGPGFLLAALYIAYCLARSFFNPKLGPPVPLDERVNSLRTLGYEFVVGVVPLAVLIAATLLALGYRKLTLETLKNAAISTIVTSSMVLFLVVGSNLFGAVFNQLGAASLIKGAVAVIPLPDMGKLLVIMAIIFLLGWPFEWPAVVLVFLPIFLPVVEALNIGLPKQELMLWFGVVVAVNLQTAFLSPPVAMSAYYLKNVMPQWGLGMIYKGMGQFMAIQVVCILLLLIWPELVLWLPRALR